MKILKVLLFAILIFPLALQAEQQNANQKTSAGYLLQDNSGDSPILSHHLTIKLQPKNNSLQVTDTITLPANGQSAFTFRLNSLFHLRYKKRPLHPIRTQNGVSSYHIAVGTARELVLSYQGLPESTPDCAWLQQNCVLLSEEGVFLDANSHWYPTIDGARHRFQMDITLPEKWVSLSQGRQTQRGWQEDKPQRSIYLLAGRFKVYESQPDPAKPKAMVYLRQDDPKLAQRYLQATHHYLAQYSKLLGDYPYAKFATLESFWETGWGMPSFTLLGPRVMRLPFILHSSFPHEILHNWWGNGVYVDSRDGNWSEGLTAYLADHYNKASKAERVAYRRDALQKYQIYTASGEDFPLRDFRRRHDRTTQAVGYNKALMLFHMLRKRLGSKQFFAGLKTFYRQYRFRFASFTELEQVFAQHSRQELDLFFRQWRDQRGAPRLQVVDYSLLPQQGDELTVKLTLRQTRAMVTIPAFSLDIPVKVQDASGHFNHQTLHMDQAQQQYTLHLKKTARRLLIDPYFDVLRIPDKREVPAVLNILFNKQRKTFVLADKLPEEQVTAWRGLLAGLFGVEGNKVLTGEGETSRSAEVLVFLGDDGTMLEKHTPLQHNRVDFAENGHIFDHKRYNRARYARALTLRAGEQQLVSLDAKEPEAIQMLAAKLAHYGKYSYVLFDSETGKNVAKGQWQMTDSPMVLDVNTKAENSGPVTDYQ